MVQLKVDSLFCVAVVLYVVVLELVGKVYVGAVMSTVLLWTKNTLKIVFRLFMILCLVYM